MKEDITALYRIFCDHPYISTDSRSIGKGSIFFALKGASFNGNDFALEALEKGASFAVIDEPPKSEDRRLYRVKNVQASLQELATFHRKQLGLKIIAITGSNGKTTTKELIHSVLSTKYNTLATSGNLNNHIGVPLTLLRLTSQNEIGVVEMGANHLGEIASYCEIAQPDYGIITNVGKAHLEGFGSFEGVIKAKTELYKYLQKTGGKVFLNGDNNYLVNAAGAINKYSYGTENADCTGKIITSHPYLELQCKFEGKDITIKSKLIGKYNFENILAAVCIGSYFKIPPELIQASIASYIPSNNRSQLVKTATNTVILDSYNANPSSMHAALENFNESDYKNKIVILGDMAELGAESETEHTRLVNLILAHGFDKVFLVGPNFEKAVVTNRFQNFASVELLGDYLANNPMKNSAILIKGSRKMQMEKILGYL